MMDMEALAALLVRLGAEAELAADQLDSIASTLQAGGQDSSMNQMARRCPDS
jgi:hypothetical protein